MSAQQGIKTTQRDMVGDQKERERTTNRYKKEALCGKWAMEAIIFGDK